MNTPSQKSRSVMALAMVFLLIAAPMAYLSFSSHRSEGSSGEVDSSRRAAPFIHKAEAAFDQNDEDRGTAFLAAALVAEPASSKALDLHQRRSRKRFQTALDNKDWADAQLQVASYDSTVRAGLQGARSVADVEDLLARQQTVHRWEAELKTGRDSAVEKELASVEEQISASDERTIRALQTRLRLLPVDQLEGKLRKRVTTAAVRLEKRRHQQELAVLAAELAEIRQAALKPSLPPTELHELNVRAQHLRARVIERKLDGGDVTQLQAGCDGLMQELGQRVQVIALRQSQQIADADARAALDQVDKIMKNQEAHYPRRTFHWSGIELAKAEILLTRIDRLCSQEMQQRAQERLMRIRAKALEYRTGQQQAYNKWAIDVLEEAMKEHKEATKVLRWQNDHEKLKEIISDKLGEIDPQHLHPVTHTLFSEMYQKILTSLGDNDLKVEVTRNVETKKKRPLSGF